MLVQFFMRVPTRDVYRLAACEYSGFLPFIFRTHAGRLFPRRLSYSELFGIAFRFWPQDFRVMVERVLGARASEIVPVRWALPGTPLAEARNVCRPPSYSM